MGPGGATGNEGGWQTGLPLPTPSEFESWKHLMMPVFFACGGAVVLLVVVGLVIWMHRPVWLLILGLAGGLVAEVEHVVRSGGSVEPRALMIGVFASVLVSLMVGWLHERRAVVCTSPLRTDASPTGWTAEAMAAAGRAWASREELEQLGREWQAHAGARSR